MAESVVVDVQKREGRGTRKARRMRSRGLLPGVIYGHKQDTVSITLPADVLGKLVRQGTRVVDIQLGGTREKALIRDLQWDHLGKEVLHIDLERVSEDERIEVEVRIELRGTAPGIAAGGVLVQPIHTLAIECLAIRIPESIRYNIGELQIGGVVHVKDLTLPEGVKALDDPDAIVVQCVERTEEAEVAPTEGMAEPEVIGRKAAEEEAAEE